MTNPTDEAKQAAEADPIDKLISTIEANYYLCDTAKEARRAYTAIRTKLEEAEKERDELAQTVYGKYGMKHLTAQILDAEADKARLQLEINGLKQEIDGYLTYKLEQANQLTQLRAELAKASLQAADRNEWQDVAQKVCQQRDELAGKVERLEKALKWANNCIGYYLDFHAKPDHANYDALGCIINIQAQLKSAGEEQ